LNAWEAGRFRGIAFTALLFVYQERQNPWSGNMVFVSKEDLFQTLEASSVLSAPETRVPHIRQTQAEFVHSGLPVILKYSLAYYTVPAVKLADSGRI
jgi:hypothetical protein